MEKICEQCGKAFIPRKKAPRQVVCGQACRRQRRRNWQRDRLRLDPDYRANQSAAQKRWRANHPDYWQKYRAGHLEYAQRNKKQQYHRNRKAREPEKVIAKMDEQKPLSIGILRQVVLEPLIAKMDELMARVRGPIAVQASAQTTNPDCKDGRPESLGVRISASSRTKLADCGRRLQREDDLSFCP